MAVRKIVVTLEWLNNSYFEVTSKEDDKSKIVIIHADENHHIVDAWKNIDNIVTTYLEKQMKKALDELSV